MAYKCVIWGNGVDYEKIINQIHFEIYKGNIEIIALISRRQDIVEKTFDSFIVIQKEELAEIQFDYLIIATSLYYDEISRQAMEMGITEEKIINGLALNLPLFDFGRYVQLVNQC